MAQRVFRTLVFNVDERRRAKALAWLVTDLHAKGTLTDDDVDELLWATRDRDD